MSNKSKYQSLREWELENKKDYLLAKRKGFLLEICDYFGWEYPYSHWRIKENTVNEARKYNSCDKWRKNSPLSYCMAVGNKWVEECVSHMEGHLKFNSFHFNKKYRCIEEAKKFDTIYEWKTKSPISYENALKNKKRGWMTECTRHMSNNWFKEYQEHNPRWNKCQNINH